MCSCEYTYAFLAGALCVCVCVCVCVQIPIPPPYITRSLLKKSPISVQLLSQKNLHYSRGRAY